VITSDVNTFSETEVSIFPNPVNTNLIIYSDGMKGAGEMCIRDLTGQEIQLLLMKLTLRWLYRGYPASLMYILG
jgi:hypothetical protein